MVPAMPEQVGRVRRLERRTFIGFSLVSVVVVPMASAAEAPSDIVQPIAALDAAILEGWKAEADTSFAQRYQTLQPAVTRALDLRQILRASVGPHWIRLPAEDQAALLAVFERYTTASYVAGFARYAGQTIKIEPDLRPVGADWIVETRIVRPEGKETRIDYVMRLASDNAERIWKAADVLLEGTISRVSVQRSDVRTSLDDRTADETSAARLIAHLQQRIADLSGGTM